MQHTETSITEASRSNDASVCRPVDPGQLHRWSEAMEAINFYLLGSGYRPRTKNVSLQSEHSTVSETIVPSIYGGGA